MQLTSQFFTYAAAIAGVAATIFTLLAGRYALKEKEAREQIPPQWATDATNQLQRMEGKLGNDAMTEAYLATQRKLTQQYAGTMASVAVEKFIDQKPDREHLRGTVKEANARLLTATKFKIQPIHDLVLGSFDGWISELRKRKTDIQISEKNDPDCATDDQAKAHFHILRTVKFANGTTARVMFVPAVIEDGRTMGTYTIAIDNTDDRQNLVQIEENAYQLGNCKPGRYTFKTPRKDGKDPAQDAEFLDAVKTGINQVMANIAEVNGGL